jgi:hypothetical protein
MRQSRASPTEVLRDQIAEHFPKQIAILFIALTIIIMLLALWPHGSHSKDWHNPLMLRQEEETNG